jgi:hypothetical protein
MLRISNPLNAKSWIAPQILLRAFLLDRYKDPTYVKKKPMESSHRQAPGCLSLVTLLDTSIPVVMNVPRRLIERLGAATMTHASGSMSSFSQQGLVRSARIQETCRHMHDLEQMEIGISLFSSHQAFTDGSRAKGLPLSLGWIF